MQPMISMRHPELDPEGVVPPARTSLEAFEAIYAEKGWRQVTDAGVLVPSREEIARLNGKELDELLGADHGIHLVEDRRSAVLEQFYPSPAAAADAEPTSDDPSGS